MRNFENDYCGVSLRYSLGAPLCTCTPDLLVHSYEAT